MKRIRELQNLVFEVIFDIPKLATIPLPILKIPTKFCFPIKNQGPEVLKDVNHPHILKPVQCYYLARGKETI